MGPSRNLACKYAQTSKHKNVSEKFRYAVTIFLQSVKQVGGPKLPVQGTDPQHKAAQHNAPPHLAHGVEIGGLCVKQRLLPATEEDQRARLRRHLYVRTGQKPGLHARC